MAAGLVYIAAAGMRGLPTPAAEAAVGVTTMARVALVDQAS